MKKRAALLLLWVLVTRPSVPASAESWCDQVRKWSSPQPIYSEMDGSDPLVVKDLGHVIAAPRRCEPSLHGSFCYAIDDHNRLQVHSSWDRDVLLSVPEFEHRPLSAKWVSAKLLYIEVSFNPHYGAYWLYDAVERRLVLKQLENDGFDTWTQCRVRP